MPAIWTDTDGRVQRIYHQTERLSDEELQDATTVDSIPDANASPNEQAQMYYTESNGFSFEYTTYPTRLKLSDDEGDRLIEAVEASDLETVVDIIEQLGIGR
jgi:hypothetical protein